MIRIVKTLSKRFFVIASILVLNNCAVNNSMMNISRMESGKENVAPTNNENDEN